MATDDGDTRPYDAAAWGEESLEAQMPDDYQPDVQLSEEQTQDPTFLGANPANAVHGDDNEDPGDDGGDYDPEAIGNLSVPSVPESKPAKPQTTGGFIIDADSEDDEEEEEANEPRVPTTGTAADSAPDQAAPSSSLYQNDHTANGSSIVQPSGTPVPAPQLEAGATGQDVPDRITVLEARVKDDPRGDMDAWLSLIDEYRRQNNLDQIRGAYNRFLDIFPHSAEAWASWVELELGLNNFVEAEQLFGRCLMDTPSVRLWTVYLNYIRRRNDLNNDSSGQARKVVSQAYDFVINTIGVDKDSARIWQDYIQFLRSGPGQIGGGNWQDQQKMDQLRKAYQKAICVPTSAVNTLWKEYDQFETGVNKMIGRKFIQEHSPSYMSAKSANIALDNMTRNLNRTTYPRLPPAPGFEGDVEFMEQVDIWKKWIAWEKEDPLDLKSDEPAVYRKRILHCYKQALMALRFVPEVWVDAAEWCFQNPSHQGTQEPSGLDFLTQGVAANPESVLLALKYADRIESTHPGGESDEAKREFANAVREPYNGVLDRLYDMCKDLKEKEQADLDRVEKTFTAAPLNPAGAYDDEDDAAPAPTSAEKENQIKAIKQGYAAQTDLLSRTISHVWIALARAMRRIQGKGGVGMGGLRQVFLEARKRGKLTSDVYVAVALMESVVYRDPVGSKIFERGMTLFPEDENYMLDYLKYLHSKDDTTNARVVFETCVNRLTQKPETVVKAKALYAYFHKYESQYGELAHISKLEGRMAELFPSDPKLTQFSQRYSTPKFNPVMAPIIVSAAAQLRPKTVMPSIEQPTSTHQTRSPAPLGGGSGQPHPSPRPLFIRTTASPKRAFPGDDYDDGNNRPRKLARGESPLKGAAGRRLDQQRRNQASALHREITFFLNILPPSSSYDTARFNSSAMTKLLQGTTIPDFAAWRAQSGGAPAGARPGGTPLGGYPGYQRGQSPYSGGSSGPGSRGYEHPGGYRQEGVSQYGTAAASSGYAPPPGQQYGGGFRY